MLAKQFRLQIQKWLGEKKEPLSAEAIFLLLNRGIMIYYSAGSER